MTLESFIRLLSSIIAAVALATASAMAQRPSVADLDSELQTLKETQCSAADANGESYRPVHCTPRCDCVEPGTMALVESCDETSPGTFVAALPVDPPATCDPSPVLFVDICSFPPVVSSCDPNLNGTDCPFPSQGCLNLVTGGAVCAVLCATAADCPVDAVAVTLDGVSTPDDASAIVQCTVEDFSAAIFTKSAISSSDANECIVQIETTLGQACNTLP